MRFKESIDISAVIETLDLIGGKWRIPIISTLRINDKCRFKDLMEKVDGIGTKMLSKELKNLENKGIVQRIIQESTPVIIEYELTLYGKTLDSIIYEISNWGNLYLKRPVGHNSENPIGHYNTIDI